MIIGIDQDTLTAIKNPVLAAYAGLYVTISSDFMSQIRQTGIEVDPHDYGPETAERLARLKQAGAISRNDDKSLYVNRISPACVACQTGVGSATYFISLKCHRDCYYCFNPNQENYDYYRQHTRDLVQELNRVSAAKQKVKHLALTGGEPLLHKDEAVAFFATADQKFPAAYKRLYTSGDHIDEAILARLKQAGLDEIRFSIRLHDLEKGHRHVFDRIALAKAFIPHVMVEMPVPPDTFDVMCDVLLELERLQLDSINLLELCYPLVDPQPFKARGFKLKRRPYRVFYNYWYAGALPIARSELVCLDLLDFALKRRLTLGVHYCSLENKHTGQLYQQNSGKRLPETHYFSQKDYLLKSAKVFGDDVPPVLAAFKQQKFDRYTHSAQHGYIEFHVGKIRTLTDLAIEIGISSSVFEQRDDGQYLRELQVDLTTPAMFDLAHDV